MTPTCPNCRHIPALCSCIPAWFWNEHQVQWAVYEQRSTDLVKLLRKKLDLRQADVARLTGIWQSSVSRVEHGGSLSKENAERVWKNLNPLRTPTEPPVSTAGPEQQEASGIIFRPSRLRVPVLEAFEANDIRIDFAGFSGETLRALLQEPLDLVREGSLRPTSLLVRVLVPDLSRPQGLPTRTDTGVDDAALRERSRGIIERSVQSLADAVYDLRHRRLLRSAEVRMRTYDGVPQLKLYVFNKSDVFVGYYPVAPNTVVLEGERVPINDLMDYDSPLFHHRRTDEPRAVGTLQVQQARTWFESIWERYAKELL